MCQILLIYDPLTYFNFLRVYVKFHLRNYYGHNMSLGLPKGIHRLKSMRYYSTYIKNISWHLP